MILLSIIVSDLLIWVLSNVLLNYNHLVDNLVDFYNIWMNIISVLLLF